MNLAGKIYVATLARGVFFTDNYVDESVQPIWTAVNTGLATLDCKEFHLDPFTPAGRQYVLVKTNNILYRRVNGGAWEEILSALTCTNLVGLPVDTVIIGGFCLDPLTPGRIWATWGSSTVVCRPQGYWAFWSDDYGDNWSWILIASPGYYTYKLGSPVAYGDIIHVAVDTSPWGPSDIYSVDGGVWWTAYGTFGLGVYLPFFAQNPLTPSKVFFWSNIPSFSLTSYTIGGVQVGEWADGDGGDNMWFDPITVGHQRTLNSGIFVATADEWSTAYQSFGTLARSFSPIDLNGEIIVGLRVYIPSNMHHTIGVMTNEADNAPVGIAGTNCDTAPYTDSIPDVGGGFCYYGIQVVGILGTIKTHAVAMPDYLGLERGVIIPSDRTRVFVDAEPANPYPGIIWVEE